MHTRLNAILKAALAAADPGNAIRRHVVRDGNALLLGRERVALNGDLRVIAVGKAAAPMASALLGLIGDTPVRGVLVTKYGHVSDACRPLRVIEAGHPVPDTNSLLGGTAVCEALAGCTADTHVLACISGGASALLVAPHAGISLNSVIAINQALLRSGADIVEMNAVRSRIDRLKAGGLVQLAQPGRVYALILSDVIGDPLNVIASGLTHDARAHNTLVGNNTQACEAARDQAAALGLRARIVTTELRGEARAAAAQIAADIQAEPTASALIYGGETTVTLRGAGAGGRNQELALASALALNGANCVVAALGTDGTDGPTDAAGAIAYPDTLARAGALGLDAQAYLDTNDSYTYFKALGDLIMTGPTGTNVADVIVALKA